VRIAHITTRLINGGADENTVACANWSAEAGNDVVLIHGRDSSPEIYAKVSPRVRVRGVPQLVRDISPLKDAAALAALKRLLDKLKPDVVHTHTSKAGILGRAAAKLAGVPARVHGVHIAPFVGTGPVPRAIYLGAERLAARWTNAFIDVSAGMRDTFLDAGIGRAANHYVVYSGMDLSAFTAPTPVDDWRALLGLTSREPKPPVVLMLATFELRKRHAELIRAFDAVLETQPDVRLVLAGGGDPHAPAIEAAVAASRSPNNIRRLGFYPNPGGLIALADVGVLCSLREGLPRVAVQYIAGGLPVVTSDLPGIGEIVTDGVNGIVTDADDVGEIGRTIADLLRNPAQLGRLKRGAKESDVSAWGVQKMGKDNQAIYDGLLAGPVEEAEARRLAGTYGTAREPRVRGL
jgi:glycosyltransferase involved in cell wall biosynthesis